MTKDELNRFLGGWKGYTLGTVQRLRPWIGEVQAEQEEIWIELVPDPQRVKRCSGCGAEVGQVHDMECSPKVDPCVMRVQRPERARRTFDARQEAPAGTDCQEAA